MSVYHANATDTSTTMTDCTFTNASADRFGGAVSVWYNAHATDTSATMTDCTFTNASAGYDGGAVSVYYHADATDTSATVTGCAFTNTRAEFGGAVSAVYEAHATNTSVSMTGCAVTRVAAGSGNAALELLFGGETYDPKLRITDSNFTHCSCTAVYVIVLGAVENIDFMVDGITTFVGNGGLAAGSGGAIKILGARGEGAFGRYAGLGNFIGGRISIRDATFLNNTANRGGALFVSNPIANTTLRSLNVVLQSAEFQGNRAQQTGGAVFLSGVDAVVNRTLFVNNSAESGGALMVRGNGDVTVSGSNFDHTNTAFQRGSAIFANNNGDFSFEDDTRIHAPLNDDATVTTTVVELEGVASRLDINGSNGLVECPDGSQFQNDTQPIKDITVVYDCGDGCSPKSHTTTSFNILIRCAACSPQTYSLANSSNALSITCRRCPEHAQCFGGANVVAAEEHWMVHSENGDELELLECSRCRGCVDGTTKYAHCTGRMFRNYCHEHRVQTPENVLCGQCEDGFVEIGEDCVECSDVQWGVIAGTVAFYIIYVVWILWLASSDVSRGLVKILVYFIQVLGLILGPMSWWAPALSFANFEFIRHFCFGPLTKIQRLWYGLVSPLGYFIILFVIWLGLRYKASRRQRRRRQWVAGTVIGDESDVSLISLTEEESLSSEQDTDPPSNRFYRALYYLALFSYETWSHQALQLLNCEDVGQHRVLTENPDVSCHSTDYHHLKTTAIVIVILFVIGFPMVLYLFLRRHHHRGVLHTETFRSKHGIAYEHYHVYWWQIEELVRRVCLIVLHVVAFDDEELRSWLLGCGCAVILILHLWYKPFHRTVTGVDGNKLETLSLSMLMFAAFTNAVFVAGESENDIVVSEEGGFMHWSLLFTFAVLVITASWEALGSLFCKKMYAERQITSPHE